MQLKYPNLFKPLQVGNTTFKNRIVAGLIIYGNMDIRHLYFTILSAKSSGKFSYALTKAVNAP